MKAVVWHGKHDMRVDNVPDPKILDPRDAIIKITSTAICGSDLHLYNGVMSGMKSGDILGHEPMGEVVEVGSDVRKLKKGDRVVVPFTISCGRCFFCEQQKYSMCDESNPNKDLAMKAMGHSPAGLFGFSHLLGGFPGGQAQYLRVPYADIGPIKIPNGIADEKVLFLSDIFPTGYMAAENLDIKPTDTVAIWGCGPVGQFAIQSARLLGAKRIIALDDVPERLQMAREFGKCETIDISKQDPYEALQAMTNERGPEKCMDAVGAEAHGQNALIQAVEDVKQGLRLPFNSNHALNTIIKCCQKGGTISVPGVYTAVVNDFMFGPAMNKGLNFKMGQTHVQKYTAPLLKLIEEEKIDPSFVITHTRPIEDAPALYDTFNKKKDNCIKVVLKPN